MTTASITPQEFVDKWRRSKLKERSASQEHFIDLCRMLGHPTPAKADPEGTTFTFQKGVNNRAAKAGPMCGRRDSSLGSRKARGGEI